MIIWMIPTSLRAITKFYLMDKSILEIDKIFLSKFVADVGGSIDLFSELQSNGIIQIKLT